MTVYYGSMGILIPYLPLLLHKTLSSQQVGTLIASGSLAMILMQPIWGWLSDRLGRKKIIITALAGTVASSTGFWYSHSFNEWLVIIGLYFIFQSPIGTLIDTIAVNEYTDRFGKIRLWGSVGFGVAVFAGGIILGKMIFLVHIFLLLIALLLVYMVKVKESSKSLRNKPKIKSVDFKWVFYRSGFVVILFLCFLASIAMKGNATFYSIGLDELGVYGWMLGTAWVLQVFPEILIFPLVDRLARKWSNILLVIIGVFSFSVYFFLLGFYQNIWIWVLSQPLVSIGFCFWYSGAIRLIKSMFPENLQGTGQTIFSAVCNGIGGMGGSMISGFIVGAFGILFFYTFAGFLSIITAALLFCFMIFYKQTKFSNNG